MDDAIALVNNYCNIITAGYSNPPFQATMFVNDHRTIRLSLGRGLFYSEIVRKRLRTSDIFITHAGPASRLGRVGTEYKGRVFTYSDIMSTKLNLDKDAIIYVDDSQQAPGWLLNKLAGYHGTSPIDSTNQMIIVLS